MATSLPQSVIAAPPPAPSPAPTPAPAGMMGPVATPAPALAATPAATPAPASDTGGFVRGADAASSTPGGFVPGSSGLTPDQISQYNNMYTSSGYKGSADWEAMDPELRAAIMSGNVNMPGGQFGQINPTLTEAQRAAIPDGLTMYGLRDGETVDQATGGAGLPAGYGTPGYYAPRTGGTGITSNGMMGPTGAPAPNTSGVTSTQIQQWLSANPGATDAQMRQTMDQAGVTVQQMAAATGQPVATIQARYDAAGASASPTGASPPPGGPSPAPAPVTHDNVQNTDITGYINQILGSGQTQAQQAESIRNAMDQYGVSPQRIVEAYGGKYSMQQVLGFLYGAASTGPVVSPSTPYGSLQQTYQPNLNQTVGQDALIEGRINNLLATDASGAYTNPVVRQAVDRATQSFAARGLVNSSMAVQAGQEAAISKAIEIAGPDAQRVYEQSRANQDAQNVMSRDQTQQAYAERNNMADWAHQDATQANDQKFRLQYLTQEQQTTLRQNYLESQDRANARYQTTIDTINSSDMTPADKSTAIQQASAVRDGDLAYNNNLFAAQPGFARDWLTSAIPLNGTNVSTINNMDALSTIANDPAQDAATRAAAVARLQEVQKNGGATSASNAAQASAATYQSYVQAGGTLTEAQWQLMRTKLGSSDYSGSAGSDADGSGVGGTAGGGTGNNANGDAAGVGAGPR